MSARILSTAIIAGLLLAVSAPAFAAEPAVPTTKADCEKMKDMKWDERVIAPGVSMALTSDKDERWSGYVQTPRLYQHVPRTCSRRKRELQKAPKAPAAA